MRIPFIAAGVFTHLLKFTCFILYKTQQISELKYEFDLIALLSIDFFAMLQLFVFLPEMTWSNKDTILFILWVITALPFFYQLIKPDTPFKRLRAEQLKLKNEYESVLKQNVLLKEIQKKHENLEKKFEMV